MAKKTSVPPLPALSVRHAHELESVENNFSLAVEHCFDAYGCIIHPVKADAYMRSYAVRFFSIYLSAYASDSLPLWIPELKVKAIEWVLTVIQNYRGVETEQLREFFRNLDETLDEYLKTLGSSPNPLLAALANPNPTSPPPPPLEIKQRMDYAAAGIDVDSASPLLQMAMAQGAQRQVVAPLPPQTVAQPPKPNLSEVLGNLLLEARWKPEDIAEKIGIVPRNVYRHLSGETKPTLSNIGSYEAALTKKLGRKIELPMPVKRQRVSNTSVKRQ